MATKIWTIMSMYLFVPVWIHFLGVEGYGVISFYTIMMTLMFFADAGLTATLTREFARGDKDEQYRRDLLKTIEMIYLGIASVLFLTVFTLSGFIVSHFLKSNMFSYEELRICVQIMGLTMAVHFMFSLYCGGLLGLQKQVLVNIVNIGYSVSRSAIVVVPLLISPTLLSFFIWQLMSIIISLIIVRYFLIQSITLQGFRSAFQTKLLLSIWKFAFGMMLMAIISGLNTQLDKIVTGNVLSLRDMGYYSLASTIGITVISISQPLGVAFYPELTRLLSCDKQKMEEILLLFTYVVSAISVTVGFTLFFYVDEFTFFWTHDPSIVQAVRVPARLLIIGNILQSFQLAPYYLALANGHTKTNVKIGMAMLVFMIPLVYLFTKEWGLKGTAIPYVVINICATIYLSTSIFRRYFIGKLFVWLKNILLPLGLISSILLIPYLAIRLIATHGNEVLLLSIGVSFGFLGLYLSMGLLTRINPNAIEYVPVKYRKWFFVKE